MNAISTAAPVPAGDGWYLQIELPNGNIEERRIALWVLIDGRLWPGVPGDDGSIGVLKNDRPPFPKIVWRP